MSMTRAGKRMWARETRIEIEPVRLSVKSEINQVTIRFHRPSTGHDNIVQLDPSRVEQIIWDCHWEKQHVISKSKDMHIKVRSWIAGSRFHKDNALQPCERASNSAMPMIFSWAEDAVTITNCGDWKDRMRDVPDCKALWDSSLRHGKDSNSDVGEAARQTTTTTQSEKSESSRKITRGECTGHRDGEACMDGGRCAAYPKGGGCLSCELPHRHFSAPTAQIAESCNAAGKVGMASASARARVRAT